MLLSFSAVLMALSGVLCILAVRIVVHRLRALSGYALVTILVLMALWSITGALELALTDVRAQMLVGRAAYLSYAFLPVSWARFIMEFVTHRSASRWRLMWGLYAVSALLILSNWLNPFGWFYTSIEVYEGAGRMVAEYHYGPLFWVYTLFNYGMLMSVLAWLAVKAHRGQMRRAHFVYLVLAVCLPVTTNALYVTKVFSFDATPLAFGATLGMLALLYRSEFFQELPLSRREIMNAMPVGIVLRNGRGDVVQMNRAAQEMLGYGRSAQPHLTTEGVLDDWMPAEDRRNTSGDDMTDITRRFLHPVEDANGEKRFYRVSISKMYTRLPGPPYTMYMLQDETDLYRAERRIRYLEKFDDATGLFNRAHFTELLAAEAERCRRVPQALGLVCFSIVGFGDYVNLYGPAFGEALQREVGSRISGILRKYDAISRFSNDEFYIMYRFENPVGDLSRLAQGVVRRTGELFDIPLLVQDVQLLLRIQAGVALCPRHSRSAEEMITMAHLAKNKAESTLKNYYCEYSSGMVDGHARSVAISQQLHTAQENGEFDVVYHPQVDATTREVVGVEALLRWNSPTLGQVSPEEFIPAAEENGLIEEIGAFVLRRAVMQATAWHKEGFEGLRMAVNVSMCQLRNQRFAVNVMELLHLSGMDPRCLELELTESVALFPEALTHSQLPRLREVGVRVAMDDFGMGHSSLAYIKQFDLDTVKIDKVLSEDVMQNETSLAMIRSVRTLCDTVGLELVVEYVEEEEQATLLKNLGCDILQGYLFSSPLDAISCTRFMKTAVEERVGWGA